MPKTSTEIAYRYMKKNIDLPFIKKWAQKKGSFLTGQLNNLNLYTALQPIFSLAHKRVVGHEALLRLKDGDSNWIPPLALFEQEMSPSDMIHLDRLCQYIHANNFHCIGDPVNWLFLNISPTTISSGRAYGKYIKELLEHFKIPAHRVVIEVVEHPIGDNDLLTETVGYYKDLGCLIAIDDFGAGHSNFNRIWTLKPDIVKLDRSFLTRASNEKNVRNVLPGIVSLLHQAGSLVLLEGIETPQQAMMAIESDADFVQGFYFGKPFTDLLSPSRQFNDFEALFHQYKTASNIEEDRHRKNNFKFTSLFKSACMDLSCGLSLEQTAEKLFTDPSIVRCYQIGPDGIQIGNTLVSKPHQSLNSKKFKPLDDATSADWFRRHYLKRAIQHPDQLQITRPYLSITGSHMCITLSMKLSDSPLKSVLCCDLMV